MDYKSSGVNAELGDNASRILYEAARLTWKNRKGRLGEVVEIFNDFSGLRAIKVGGLPPDTYMNISFDGVGTKVELAERTMKHDTMAYDLFAMICDDTVVRGAEPVIVGSILDVKSLGKDKNENTDFLKQLAAGYVNAARDANVAIVNGEVAELGARVSGYGKFNYNWGAGVVWFARKNRMLTGYEVKSGDKLVALREEGFRSNGLSLVRKIMEASYGKEWHNHQYDGKNIGELVLHPSRIYSGAVVDVFGGFDGEPKAEIHGIAHITGGGLPGKLARVLKPSKLGAHIEDPFQPCDMMLNCQELGGVDDFDAYRTWNMGQGMLIITPSPDSVMSVAQEHRIESKVIGEITANNKISIKSNGLKNKTITFG